MRNILIALISFIAFLAVGCADQEPQKVVLPQKTVKPHAEQKSSDIAPAISTKEKAIAPFGYEYNPQGRRDPFASLIVKQEALEKKKGATPLEQDEIDTLRLTAVVWRGYEYHALITLPGGKSYTVKRGVRLGLDGGVIYDITKDAVVVRQYLKDRKGNLKPKDLILRLRMEE